MKYGEWSFNGLISLLFKTPIRLEIIDGEDDVGGDDVSGDEGDSSFEFSNEPEELCTTSSPHIDNEGLYLPNHISTSSTDKHESDRTKTEAIQSPLVSNGNRLNIIHRESMYVLKRLEDDFI